MSSTTGCPSNSKLCAQPYPIRDYFLALFITVVCLVCLRMLLYASYHAWLRIEARRQMLLQPMESPPLGGQGLPSAAGNSLSISTPPVFEPRVFVIVPGKDRPTFVAMPAPLAPSRDSVKASDTPKL
ncbi:hypothetical protein GOP47_0019201 [Adiantum capillus-veneris]|uniref:Uncharacterized protein n=1 Tax=Adiantum capillus-veneris TaxID=13818 RepID=A0A9D4ZAA5_ADICA|nr:hypothetical protein GOP47_0019201 [Adiantum capillus-veneris]